MAWSWIILGWIQNLEKWKEKILFGKICIFTFLEVYIRSRQSGYITSRLGWHAGTTRVSVKIASISQLFTLFCIQHGLTEDKNDTDIKTEIILWIPLPRKRVDHLHFPRGPFQKHKSTQINVGWNGWKIPGILRYRYKIPYFFWEKIFQDQIFRYRYRYHPKRSKIPGTGMSHSDGLWRFACCDVFFKNNFKKRIHTSCTHLAHILRTSCTHLAHILSTSCTILANILCTSCGHLAH